MMKREKKTVRIRKFAAILAAALWVAGLALGSGAQNVWAGTMVGVVDLKQTDGDNSWFKVEWEKDINAEAYEFQYSADGENWSSSSYTIYLGYSVSRLSSGHSYYVRMRAYDKESQWYVRPADDAVFTEWCTPIEVVTAPKTVEKIVQTDAAKDSVSVEWEAAEGATKYRVYYVLGYAAFEAGETAETSYTVKKLDPDKGYEIRVVSIRESAAGFEACDGYASHTCYTASPKVKELKFDSWNTPANEVAVSWKDGSGTNTGFEVYVTNLAGKKVKNLKTTDTYVKFKISSLKNKGFIFKVRTYKDIDGTSIYSDWSSQKVVVAQPKLTIKRTGAKQLQLSWTKISGAKGYTVYRSTGAYTGFKKIKTTKSTKLTNKGLSTGKTYYYYVAANGVKANGKTYSSTKATSREVAYCSSYNGKTVYLYE